MTSLKLAIAIYLFSINWLSCELLHLYSLFLIHAAFVSTSDVCFKAYGHNLQYMTRKCLVPCDPACNVFIVMVRPRTSTGGRSRGSPVAGSGEAAGAGWSASRWSDGALAGARQC